MKALLGGPKQVRAVTIDPVAEVQPASCYKVSFDPSLDEKPSQDVASTALDVLSQVYFNGDTELAEEMYQVYEAAKRSMEDSGNQAAKRWRPWEQQEATTPMTAPKTSPEQWKPLFKYGSRLSTEHDPTDRCLEVILNTPITLPEKDIMALNSGVQRKLVD
jgi:hypothetical protein